MYRHRQIGTVVLVCTLGAAVLATAATAPVFGWYAPLVGLVFALLAWLFGTLTVEVGSGVIRLGFGPGLIKKTIELAEVTAAEPVRNHVWHGFGIRYVPGSGWMWNVSGLDAVELTYRSGKHFRIGTDQPSALQAAITEAAQLG